MAKAEQINGFTTSTVPAVISTTSVDCGIGVYQLSAGTTVGVIYDRLKYYESGTLSLFTVVVTSSTTGSACTATIQKGGSPGNQTVSIGTAASGTFTDNSNTDSVVNGDLWYMNFSTVSSGTALVSGISTVFDAASNTSNVLGKLSSAGAGASPPVGFFYFGPSGGASTVESSNQAKIKTDGTLQNLYFYINANSAVTATFGTRLNGVSGNLVISVTGATTGTFEDTSHTDTVHSGDLFCFYSSR